MNEKNYGGGGLAGRATNEKNYGGGGLAGRAMNESSVYLPKLTGQLGHAGDDGGDVGHVDRAIVVHVGGAR